MFVENGFAYCFHSLSSNVSSDKITTVYYMIINSWKIMLVYFLYGVKERVPLLICSNSWFVQCISSSISTTNMSGVTRICILVVGWLVGQKLEG